MIRSRTVRARDGALWRIRRHWAPRPRLRGPLFNRRKSSKRRKSGGWDWLEVANPLNLLDGIDSLTALLVILGAAIVIVFMIFIGVPLLIFLVETLLIIPVLLVLGVAGRVLFGRPWTLEAARVEPPGATVVWHVVGWGVSERAVGQMAGMIRATGSVPEAPAPEGPRAHRRVRR